MSVAAISVRAEAALETFAKEPFTFALKPVVKRVLQSIASSKPLQPQVRPVCLSSSYVVSLQRLSHVVQCKVMLHQPDHMITRNPLCRLMSRLQMTRPTSESWRQSICFGYYFSAAPQALRCAHTSCRMPVLSSLLSYRVCLTTLQPLHRT